jgi:hypothetical protein
MPSDLVQLKSGNASYPGSIQSHPSANRTQPAFHSMTQHEKFCFNFSQLSAHSRVTAVCLPPDGSLLFTGGKAIAIALAMDVADLQQMTMAL